MSLLSRISPIIQTTSSCTQSRGPRSVRSLISASARSQQHRAWQRRHVPTQRPVIRLLMSVYRMNVDVAYLDKSPCKAFLLWPVPGDREVFSGTCGRTGSMSGRSTPTQKMLMGGVLTWKMSFLGMSMCRLYMERTSVRRGLIQRLSIRRMLVWRKLVVKSRRPGAYRGCNIYGQRSTRWQLTG